MVENEEYDSSSMKPSSHHNFQKHTVTALKDLVKEEEFINLCSGCLAFKATTKLWKEFLRIKGKSIMTKRFLSILFKNDINSVEVLRAYGFKQIF